MFGRDIAQLGEQEFEVRSVVTVSAGPAGGEDPRCTAEDVDADSRVVGDGGVPCRGCRGTGLDEGVLGERDSGFGDIGQSRLGGGEHLGVCTEDGSEDGQQLSFLALIVSGEDEGRHPASTSDWMRVSSVQPWAARSSSLPSSSRSNGAPSAVPWTSMNFPEPVMTTFISVSARESST